MFSRQALIFGTVRLEKPMIDALKVFEWLSSGGSCGMGWYSGLV
jgi:hypothetical protein